MKHKLLQKIDAGNIILGDGAMGTQLYQRGVYINRNFDALNLTDSHLVKAVHRDYIKAGAKVLETNTFGANTIKLSRHGYGENTFEINKIGAQLAKRCADEGANVLVAGSIGPIGKPVMPFGKITQEDAAAAFAEQVGGLLAGGIDFFILETFINLEEIKIAINEVRKQSDLPITALMTINEAGFTTLGQSCENIARVLNRQPVDIIGLNCSTGPIALLEGIKRMRPLSDKPFAAFPNAGEPKVIENRILYLSTPEYFAEYTKRFIQNGVSLIGGCCGTTPDHIRNMASTVRAACPVLKVTDHHVVSASDVSNVEVEEVEMVEPEAAEKRSPLAKLLKDGAFPVSCELHPPRSPRLNNIFRQVKLLKKAGINTVNIPDGPRASARMSPMALAHLIQHKVGMQTILHYTCRDRNILGMQSDLLGAEALNLNNILCVTGDPPKLGDYPMATAVFDVDSIGLLRIGNNLNHGLDLAGNPIPKNTSFFFGAGFNPSAIDLGKEIDRLHKKIDAGAEYILTQPVFDQEKFFNAIEAANIDVPVFVGLLPLASYRNAKFFHNEVPGMDVPAEIRQRMKTASEKGKEFGFQEGIKIAQESLQAVREFAKGAYVMPSFGKVEMAIETVSILDGRPALSEIQSDSEK